MPQFEMQYRGESLYRLDFLALLSSMAVSHILIGNPFFGASVYLFADIVKAYYFCNIGKLRRSGGEHYLSRVLLSLVFIGGLAVAFLYPVLMNVPRASYVSLFVFCIVLRDFFSACQVMSGSPGLKYYISALLVHLCFDVCCIYLIYGKMDDMLLYAVVAVVLLTGILKLFFPERHLPAHMANMENIYEEIASYRLFSDMNLYATIALNLGIMVFFFNMLTPMGKVFDAGAYVRILAWISVMAIVIVMAFLLTRVRKNRNKIAPAEFISGAMLWLAGTILMSRSTTRDLWLLWTCLWGLGIALISSSVRKFYLDFEAVGRLLGEEYDREKLEISNTMIATVASIVSSVVMLVLIAVWTFVIPMFPDGDLPALFRVAVMQLPVVFMVVAVILALKHPLDFRNREKLMRFIEENGADEKMKENLRGMFVSKYRMRFGIKIICTLARPFLRLKVSGMENLRKEEYPSVFVCNHGFIYGPISAVIYLPTYFRPWIHNVMLGRESARKELGKSLRIVTRILGRKIGGALLDLLTRLTCWALNSFNPIPVVRGASRDVMTTFNESLKALEEGDNILIFPEKPKNMVGLPEDADAYRLRSFYTGFAHVGKMYFDKTGKSLCFYPLYSDRDRRVFRIGKPVRYDPGLEPHEGKKAVAEQLQGRMEELASGQ